MCVNLRLDNYLVPKESIYSVALCTCVVIWHLKKYYGTLLSGSFETSDDETVFVLQQTLFNPLDAQK